MKKLTIRAIGSLQETWHPQAIHMYAQRLRPFAQIDIIELPEGHQGSAKPNIPKTQVTEGQSLLKGIPKDATVILLDELGKEYTSPQFATQLETWSEGGRQIVFLIGGSWGVSDEVRKQANAIVSFGKMTLPHALARIVLMEQIYRGMMIGSGKVYQK